MGHRGTDTPRGPSGRTPTSRDWVGTSKRRPGEARGAHEYFRVLDRDQDQVLTPAEAGTDPHVEGRFTHLDTNGDFQLSRQECRAAYGER